MGYTLTKGTDPMKIAEQQYATGSEIKFTAFTSCVGIIARKGSSLTGVHLVLKAKDESIFDQAAATAVHAVLPDKYDEVMIIGCVNIWQNPSNNVQAAFEKLQAGISSLQKVQIYNFTDGTYGGAIEGGKIDVTY